MPDERFASLHDFIAPMRVEPGRRVRLPDDFDPGYTADFVQKDQAKAMLKQGVEGLSEFQMRLAAQDTWSVLVIFQAMDAAGKDGTIRHVMSGVNPQGVEVTSFKAPSPLEQDHDYLWRAAQRLPPRGHIGIFNRSYYEEVLVVRVHPAILETQRMPDPAKGADVWERRYREINDWERYLTDNGTKIVKLFLNVSKEEQKRRFLDRIEEPESNWKFSATDVRERRYWDDYQAAFADMLSGTSTPWAPWHVIPADRKWFMRVAASSVILDALMELDPRYPVPTEAERTSMLAAKQELLAEDDGRDGEADAPRGDDADGAAAAPDSPPEEAASAGEDGAAGEDAAARA